MSVKVVRVGSFPCMSPGSDWSKAAGCAGESCPGPIGIGIV